MYEFTFDSILFTIIFAVTLPPTPATPAAKRAFSLSITDADEISILLIVFIFNPEIPALTLLS